MCQAAYRKQPMDDKDARKNVEVMLSLGGSFSEICDFLSNEGVADPKAIIHEVVNNWVEEDKDLSASRRAVQRRRLQRQVRLAMDSEKVGDAVRAEAILARLDDLEADAEANRTQNDFDTEMEGKSDEEINFFVDHGRFPDKTELLPQEPEEPEVPAEEPVH